MLSVIRRMTLNHDGDNEKLSTDDELSGTDEKEYRSKIGMSIYLANNIKTFEHQDLILTNILLSLLYICIKDQISYQHEKLLDDVIDDYKSISIVKSKFAEWKNEFNEDYRRAYGDLSLPGIFEFYIRYEVLLSEDFQVFILF